MPIKDLSENVRLPRLGKIRLGTRHPEKGYPQKADHFVFPKEHSDYKKLVELYGEASKELRVLIPVEDEETWATQYYRAYNQTYGLVCKGDGEVATRMVDVKTKELPDAKKPGTVAMMEIPCAGPNCPDYQAKKCHEVMNLRFILPEVPGLGVWQIDTGSKNSILNINSCARLIKLHFKRISMIPLKLTFEPIQVNNPETGKKQTVYVLNLRTDVTLKQLADAARNQVKQLEAPDLEHAFEVEVEKDIDELWGEKEHVDKTTGEIKEPVVRGEHSESPAQAEKKKSKEAQKAEPPPAPDKLQQPPEPLLQSEKEESKAEGQGEPKIKPYTVADLIETMKLCNWSVEDVKSFAAARQWTARTYKQLSPEQLTELIDEIKADPK